MKIWGNPEAVQDKQRSCPRSQVRIECVGPNRTALEEGGRWDKISIRP
jgi:hypothetical protein